MYASSKHFDKLSSLISASGILAKDENSSTNFPISSTCLDIVLVRSEISSLSVFASKNFFSILSAESLMGVRGFLTSCAIFLAISDQAACFSAKIKDVASSRATTYPSILLSLISLMTLILKFL